MLFTLKRRARSGSLHVLPGALVLVVAFRPEGWLPAAAALTPSAATGQAETLETASALEIVTCKHMLQRSTGSVSCTQP